jgi:hypothetical protein
MSKSTAEAAAAPGADRAEFPAEIGIGMQGCISD